ncbi:15799_t:CDS:2, partial [Acaulospora colombiana]
VLLISARANPRKESALQHQMSFVNNHQDLPLLNAVEIPVNVEAMLSSDQSSRQESTDHNADRRRLSAVRRVVARKTCCTLEPGESMPEPEEVLLRRQQRSSKPVDVVMDDAPSSAHLQIGYEEEEVNQTGHRRAMVPEELLQGPQRVVTVRSEGMRDAIALLDRQFGCS